MQKSINKLHDKIEILGLEIGKIKDRMIHTALTGEIRRLGIIGDKGK